MAPASVSWSHGSATWQCVRLRCAAREHSSERTCERDSELRREGRLSKLTSTSLRTLEVSCLRSGCLSSSTPRRETFPNQRPLQRVVTLPQSTCLAVQLVGRHSEVGYHQPQVSSVTLIAQRLVVDEHFSPRFARGKTSRPAPVCIYIGRIPFGSSCDEARFVPSDLIRRVASFKVSTGSLAVSDKCATPFTALSVSIASRA